MWCAVILVFVLGLILYCNSNQVAQISVVNIHRCIKHSPMHILYTRLYLFIIFHCVHSSSLRNQKKMINIAWVSIFPLAMLQTTWSFQKQIKQRLKVHALLFTDFFFNISTNCMLLKKFTCHLDYHDHDLFLFIFCVHRNGSLGF